jgi:predicted ATPase
VNENLRQFLDAAGQIAEVSGLDGFRLGLVATHDAPRIVVALSVVLDRISRSPAGPSMIQAGPLFAFQHVFPLAELAPLIEGLEAGVVRVGHDALTQPPLHLKPPGETGPAYWNFSRMWSGAYGLASQSQTYSTEVRKVLGNNFESINRQVASGTNYAYASLDRLIKAYAGLQLEGRDSTWSLLAAPWPVHNLSARNEGHRLRVDVDGMEGLDPSRFILNIEGWQEDRRLDAGTLRWQVSPGSTRHTRLYTALVDTRGLNASAVNLFIAQAPALTLRAEIQREIPQSMFDPNLGEPPASPPEQELAEGTRLTALRLGAFRLLRSIELHLEPPFAVIVGPNQSGKSSVLDALQLLADAARGELATAVVKRRGGFGAILSRNAPDALVHLEAEFQAPTGQRLRYFLKLGPVGAYDYAVEHEVLAEYVKDAWTPLLTRQGMQAGLGGRALSVGNSREAMLSQLGGMAPTLVKRVQAALAAIAVYPYFRTGASWADPEAVPMRRPSRLEPGARLDPTGSNLAAALFSLRDERPDDWQDFLGIVRLAFPSLKDLRLPAVSRGMVQLFWDDVDGGSFDASELSDGTLSFLSILCALFQPGSALIAVDEPEAHLHPDALMRLIGAARSLSERQPILLTTQSDTLIGLLDDIPESIVVARREGDVAQLVRPRIEELRAWLKGFSLRDMRRELEGWGPAQ